MPRKKKTTLTEFIEREATAALAADTAGMSKADLLDSMLDNYSKLQRLWNLLLAEEHPRWPLLEQVSTQMKTMETTLEPLLRCL